MMKHELWTKTELQRLKQWVGVVFLNDQLLPHFRNEHSASLRVPMEADNLSTCHCQRRLTLPGTHSGGGFSLCSLQAVHLLAPINPRWKTLSSHVQLPTSARSEAAPWFFFEYTSKIHDPFVHLGDSVPAPQQRVILTGGPGFPVMPGTPCSP